MIARWRDIFIASQEPQNDAISDTNCSYCILLCGKHGVRCSVYTYISLSKFLISTKIQYQFLKGF